MKKLAQRSTTDDLGLSAWVRAAAPADALGSLAGALGDFLPAPVPRIVVPAQRTGTLIEAAR